MTLSEIRRLLSEHQLQLTRSLGQNFLHDGNQVRRIVSAAGLTSQDAVLEIGPGLGPLTEVLAVQARQVLAIEKDRRLFELLTARLGHCHNLSLRLGDAVEYLASEPRDWSQWKVVSNLPYSVASPLLVLLTQGGKGPQRLAVTVQWEVAQRLNARIRTRDYGVLTLLVRIGYQLVETFKIPASCFFPEPDVDSACVTLVPRLPPLLPPEWLPLFCRVVKRSFSQRRKMMFKLLRSDWPEEPLQAGFAVTSIPLQARAEEVDLEQYARLARHLALHAASQSKENR